MVSKVDLLGISAAIGTGFTYLIGGWDMVVQWLLIFMVFDILTGVLVAMTQHEVSSDQYLKGLTKKLGVLIMLMMANGIDVVADLEEPVIRTAVVWAALGYEGISILENIVAIGVPVPDVLRRALANLKAEGEYEREMQRRGG